MLDEKKDATRVLSPYYVKISKQYSITKKKTIKNDAKRSLFDYSNYIVQNLQDEIDQNHSLDAEDPEL